MSTPVTASMLYDLVSCPHRVTMDLFADPAQREEPNPVVGNAQVVLQGAVHPGHHVAYHLGGVYQTPSCLRRAGSKASRKGS